MGPSGPGSLPQPLPEPQELAPACQPSVGPAAQAPTCKRLEPAARRGLHLPRHPTAAAPVRALAHRGSPSPAPRPAARSARALGEPGLRPHWACPGRTGQLGSRAGTPSVAGQGGASDTGRGHTGGACPGSLGIVVGWTSACRLILGIQVQASSPLLPPRQTPSHCWAIVSLLNLPTHQS